MKKIFISVFLMLAFLLPNMALADNAHDIKMAQKAIHTSATILLPQSSGSGVFIVKKIDGKNVAFVLTAAHVVKKSIVSRNRTLYLLPPRIIKNKYNARGIFIGTIKTRGRMIAYSSVERGYDLSVLIVVDEQGQINHDFADLQKTGPEIGDLVHPAQVGSTIYHIGNLMGDSSDFFSKGMIAFLGRYIKVKRKYPQVLDEITSNSVSGGSGGGIFDHQGKLIGVLTAASVGYDNMGAMRPIRDIYSYLYKNNMGWLVTDKIETPSLEDLMKIKPKVVLEDTNPL